MGRRSQPSVELELGTIEELFEPPGVSPWHGAFDTRTGMDRLREEVEPHPGPLTVHIAATGVAERGLTPPRVSAAVRAYCDVHIARIDANRMRIARLGRKELAVGLAFLGGCLALSAAIAAMEISPAWLGGFLSEGLIIIGWIALWHPVDMLFFDRTPLVRQLRVLRRIQGSRIVLEESAHDPDRT